MLSSASWETMRIVPAKQMHTQGSLKFIDWGKRFLVDVHINSRSLLDLPSKVLRLKKGLWHRVFLCIYFLSGIGQIGGSRGEGCWAVWGALPPSPTAPALQSPTAIRAWWNQQLCPRNGPVQVPTQRQEELKIEIVSGAARPGRLSKAPYQPSAVVLAESTQCLLLPRGKLCGHPSVHFISK